METPITFSKHHQKFVIGVLDIVDSTKLTLDLSADEIDSFYTILFDELYQVIAKTTGTLLKNIGDGILFYCKDPHDGITIAKKLLLSRSLLNKRLIQEKLPMISFRISMSYGKISAMVDVSGNVIDIFGATMNTCVKFNKHADPNTIVIGEALHNELNLQLPEKEHFQVNKDFSFSLHEIKV